jgi:hypothetical protein
MSQLRNRGKGASGVKTNTPVPLEALGIVAVVFAVIIWLASNS